MRRSLAAVAATLVMAAGLWAGQGPQSSGRYQGTAAARALFKKGEQAQETGNNTAALKYFQQAITVDPDYADAQENYVFAYEQKATAKEFKAVLSKHETAADDAALEKKQDQVEAELQAKYQKLAAAHPRDAVYPWVLGGLNDENNPLRALRYYHQALRLDPKFAPAYEHMSYLDESRGQLAASREDLRQAHLSDPENAEYFFDYAYGYKDADPAEFQRLAMAVVRQFPQSSAKAEALFWLADAAPNDAAKLRYLTLLRDDQAPAAQDMKGGGLQMLFGIEMRRNPAAALKLAQQMVKTDASEKWAVDFAGAVVKAEELIREGQGQNAVAVLATVHVPHWRQQEGQQLALLKARALAAAGQNEKAYASVLDMMAARPTPEARQELNAYGKRLGKTPEQIGAELWARRVKTSRPAVGFALTNYRTGKTTSLADLRGRVFLLNFFYPLCGPCRGEFPYIRGVLDKYQKQGFEIVAINVVPKQDAFVLSELKGFHLNFIPLRGSGEWATAKYHVRGEPTSFLIGADGRIYFGPIDPVESPRAQKTLEMQVETLLRHAKGRAQLAAGM
ncbi:MAG: redoxin domain-containing protein [Terriglobales bacterium]